MSETKTKTKEETIAELKEMIVEKEGKINKLTQRGLVVTEENNMLKSSSEISVKKAQLEYDLSVARAFNQSGALPFKNEHQIYTVMMAGKEMGLSPMRALNSLYIVKGQVRPHSSGMVSLITSNGYQIKYVDEDPTKVTVQCWRDGEMVVEEKVKDTDDLIRKSSAAKNISKKHKMRFHGVRLILTFSLPHLVAGINPELDLIDNKELQDGLDGIDSEKVDKARGIFEDAEVVKLKRVTNTQLANWEIQYRDGDTDIFDQKEKEGYKYSEQQEEKIQKLIDTYQ